MKFSKQFTIETDAIPVIKNKMLNWLKQFGIFAYLDNNAYQNLENRYEFLVGAGGNSITQPAEVAKKFGKTWLMGHINYDFKNVCYPDLKSENLAFFNNAILHFFEPNVVLYIPYGTHHLVIESDLILPEIIYAQMMASPQFEQENKLQKQIVFKQLLDKKSYCAKVDQVKAHIRAGDCYELNLCVAAHAQVSTLDPYLAFYQLNKSNPAPFAALYRHLEHYAICSSPERFLYKKGNRIIAQPMKGTIKRGVDEGADELLKMQLFNDPKERAENVMITDLMRNDLAKSSKVGSINVRELFGVYTFPTLHTMVSTVEGELKPTQCIWDAILKAFPMGSMTGAPKKIVMEIIESLEPSKRELYSGSIGYYNPDGNFDFNVVIRSLLYNENTQTLSYQTGGAITIDSDPEKEWEEVQLKAKALEKVFE